MTDFTTFTLVRLGGVRSVNYDTWESDGRSSTVGTVVEEVPTDSRASFAEVNLLKLHGSLNFPMPKGRSAAATKPWNIAKALPEPFILPPVFNKLAGDAASSMWTSALDHLRSAKNVVVVGYSLPQTDIYMQYFLKAALGPNLDLNKLIVFDPVLFSSSTGCAEMKHRYESCFSPQLRSRILFDPIVNPPSTQQGTAEAFVRMLESEPAALLF